MDAKKYILSLSLLIFFSCVVSAKSITIRHRYDLQSQFAFTNTSYIIKKSVDLQGRTITIPEGCILIFKKGFFTNGKIVFNNTIIKAKPLVCFRDIEVEGTLLGEQKYTKWFSFTQGNHDDWALFKALLGGEGVLFVDSQTYNLPKELHLNESIRVHNNSSIIGESRSKIIAGHSAKSYDLLFDLVECKNVYIKNLEVVGNPSIIVNAPTGFTEKYKSSGLIMFYINNNCDNITFENVKCKSAGYGIKTSKYSNYQGEELFKNITIIDCELIADMPIQGHGFANLRATNSRFISLGTSLGNHSIYVLNSLSPKLSAEEASLIFEKCLIQSPKGDGQCVQIYDSNDNEKISNDRFAFFNDCNFETFNNGIVSSASATIIVNNSCIVNKHSTDYNSKGDLIFNSCTITNATLYHAEANHCDISGSMIIVGGNTNYGPVVLNNCNVTASNYLIYNNTDECVPIIKNCKVTIEGDGIISQRNNQVKPVEFYNCTFNIKERISYSPNKLTNNTLRFVNCEINSDNPADLYTTNSGNKLSIELKNCTSKGSTIQNTLVKE